MIRDNKKRQYGSSPLWRGSRNTPRAYVLLACLTLAALFVLVIHPALHPLELINPGTSAHHACPLSYVAAALVTVLPWVLGAGLALVHLPAPLPWFGHSYFIYPLAPRPPPASLP